MNEIDSYRQGYVDGYADATKILKEATTDFIAKIADQLSKDVARMLEERND